MGTVPLHKLVVKGKTDDGSHELVATMFEHADHVDKLHAYLLSSGYDVDVHGETDDAPEVDEADYELHPDIAAHHEYAKATHKGDDEYTAAGHVARLRSQKGLR